MDEKRKNMIKVADNPRGPWGLKMLEHMHTRHRRLIRWGLGDLDCKAHRDVLDIGCGSGNALGFLYRRNKSAHYFGLDYSKDSVKVARRNNREAIRLGHMKIAHGDVCDMPYPDRSFDLIISVESFYYWKDYDRAMREICRVLKKNGTLRIVLEANADAGDAEKYEEEKSLIRNMFIPGEKDFREMFERAGLRCTIERKGDWIRAEGTLR
ncbi:MAG: class I SAM-dependent methyltransferase [Anaerovoracaceae bacterium]|jgi:SAM-dependent methyltransferase